VTGSERRGDGSVLTGHWTTIGILESEDDVFTDGEAEDVGRSGKSNAETKGRRIRCTGRLVGLDGTTRVTQQREEGKVRGGDAGLTEERGLAWRA
jgi:hypothetical protein